VKIVTILEIFAAIFVGLTQLTGLDEVEHDFTEILGFRNAPTGQHLERHRPEFLQCVLPDAFHQFLAGYVSLGALFRFLKHLDGVVEPLTDENIGLHVITGIILTDLLDGFDKRCFAHNLSSGLRVICFLGLRKQFANRWPF
jgi:hypothetical protein